MEKSKQGKDVFLDLLDLRNIPCVMQFSEHQKKDFGQDKHGQHFQLTESC